MTSSATEFRPFVRRLRLRNFRSVGQCDIELAPLTLLVGRNGAGKSNLLDSLRFVADGLQTSLDHAVKARGGLDAVRRRSTGHPRNFAIELELQLPEAARATYGFEIEAQTRGGFRVKREEVTVWEPRGKGPAGFKREGDKVESNPGPLPPVPANRLLLVTAAGLPQFQRVYEALVSMGFYNLNPEAMRELQSADAGELLHRDGSNLASVVARLREDAPQVQDRIQRYLRTIVPGITEVERASLGPKETVLFRQKVTGARDPWKFYAASMSDGTLRALGALVAVTQLADRQRQVSLVGLEEPETALHPAAASALMDALHDASAHTQIVVTTHSPDLLDQVRLDTPGTCLLAVQSREGESFVAPIDVASLQAIQDHLYTPGDLLRMDQLVPDEADLRRQQQMELFQTPLVPV